MTIPRIRANNSIGYAKAFYNPEGRKILYRCIYDTLRFRSAPQCDLLLPERRMQRRPGRFPPRLPHPGPRAKGGTAGTQIVRRATLGEAT